MELKVRAIVRVKRANVEFAPGLGIGVLATQEFKVQVPLGRTVTDHRVSACIHDVGQALLDDSVEVIYEEVK